MTEDRRPEPRSSTLFEVLVATLSYAPYAVFSLAALGFRILRAQQAAPDRDGGVAFG